MKKLITGISLFLIAVIFTAFFTAFTLPGTVLYYLFSFRWKSGIKKMGEWFYQMALSIDQFANVSLQNQMNFTMVKRHAPYHPFGDEDDTLSYIIAVNKSRNTLSRFGLFWAWFLNFVDPSDGGHLSKAIDNKMHRDLQAWRRIEEINDSKYLNNGVHGN